MRQPHPIHVARGAAPSAPAHPPPAFAAALRDVDATAREFVGGMIQDGVDAAAGFGRCTTPLEALAVQQAWLLARWDAHLRAGLQFFGAAGPYPVPAPAEVFHLPD
jgi:hypothetical protein